jgi:hypothetical protein
MTGAGRRQKTRRRSRKPRPDARSGAAAAACGDRVGLENKIRQVTDLEPRHQLHNKQNRMRRRGCGADLCPVTAQVCVTAMPGISEVPHKSIAVRGVAGLAWQVPPAACGPFLSPGRAPGRRRTGPGPRLRQAGASVTCPAGARDGRVAMGASDVAGLSWTSWDMIQNVRRADQAHSEATDATRTERGFHAARNGESAGQRAFRWAGTGSL